MARFNKAETLDELASEYSGWIMTKLIEGGGPGFKSAVFQAMQAALLWHQEKLKERPRGKDRKR